MPLAPAVAVPPLAAPALVVELVPEPPPHAGNSIQPPATISPIGTNESRGIVLEG